MSSEGAAIDLRDLAGTGAKIIRAEVAGGGIVVTLTLPVDTMELPAVVTRSTGDSRGTRYTKADEAALRAEIAGGTVSAVQLDPHWEWVDVTPIGKPPGTEYVQGTCKHLDLIPVESIVTGETIAHLCGTCLEQIRAESEMAP